MKMLCTICSSVMITAAVTVVISGQVAIGSVFIKDQICGVAMSERVKQGCAKEVTARGREVLCVDLCDSDVNCIRASIDEAGKCFHLQECPQLAWPCSEGFDTQHAYWSRYCLRGRMDSSNRACVCEGFSSGERCQSYIKECNDLSYPEDIQADVGHWAFIEPYQNGRYPPLRVLCKYDSFIGKITTVILRTKGFANANRTWSEYVNGFDTGVDNVWIGLAAWDVIDSRLYCPTKYFKMTFKGGDPNPIVRQYGFCYMYERDLYHDGINFAFHFGSSRLWDTQLEGAKNCCTCLEPFDYKPFSTWDKDNDRDSTNNCAAQSGFGWWYSGCDAPCNLFGVPEFNITGFDMTTYGSMIEFVEILNRCI